MDIIKKPFGEYQTNAYILSFNDFEFVIDPGIGSCNWVMNNTKNLKAILITHGHFDHIWDVAQLKKATNVPIYCPKEDAFMLETDCFNLGLNVCSADVYVDCNKNACVLNIAGVEVIYWHFPGHTPGCSIIEINDHLFTGDFVFYRSIGRYDFPYSNASDMKDSLQRFMQIDNDFMIHPGHGKDTYVKAEQKNIPIWISQM